MIKDLLFKADIYRSDFNNNNNELRITDQPKPENLASHKRLSVPDFVHNFNPNKIEEINDDEENYEEIIHNENIVNDTLDYLLGGVLPMVYKYITSFYSSVNYKEKPDIIKAFQYIFELIELFENFHEGYFRLLKIDDNLSAFKRINWTKIRLEYEGIVRRIQTYDKFDLAENLRTCCETIMESLLLYFNGRNIYIELIQHYREISYHKWEESLSMTRYNEETDDAEIIKYVEIYNALIKKYSMLKSQYISSSDDDGLLGFFKENKENMYGIVETLFDRLFNDIDESYDENKDIIENSDKPKQIEANKLSVKKDKKRRGSSSANKKKNK